MRLVNLMLTTSFQTPPGRRIPGTCRGPSGVTHLWEWRVDDHHTVLFSNKKDAWLALNCKGLLTNLMSSLIFTWLGTRNLVLSRTGGCFYLSYCSVSTEILTQCCSQMSSVSSTLSPSMTLLEAVIRWHGAGSSGVAEMPVALVPKDFIFFFVKSQIKAVKLHGLTE